MEEIELLKELLEKALDSGVISSTQRQFYLLKYTRKELTLTQIQKAISQPRKATRRYPLLYGDYLLKDRVGLGGMGEIFKAYHKETHKMFALKKIRQGTAEDFESQEKNRKRFLRECSLQAKLDHPYIVKVHDYGSIDRDIFLVTEFIEGKTLQDFIEDEKMELERYFETKVPQLLAQMRYICDAVDYAHKKGIVHRDINPRNIMIDSEQIWIMDFGLAKRFDVDMTKVTKSTEVIGTPSYMSPEQWTGKKLGPPSDIYSLGATLYYIVTGHPPHPEDPMGAAYNILNRISPNPIQDFGCPLPKTVEDVILKAMAYQEGDRYETASELGETLAKALRKWRPKTNLSRRIYSSYVKFLESLKGKNDP